MSKNKHTLFFLILLSLAALLLSSCVKSITAEPTITPISTGLLEELLSITPTTDDTAADTLIETAVQETLNAQNTLAAEEAQPTETEEPEETTAPEPSATVHVITPTATQEATEEEPETTDTADTTPEATQTNTPQPTLAGVQIVPEVEFTGAKHVETFNSATAWLNASGELSDSDYLKLDIEDGIMTVNGKLPYWDTWWISGFTLTDFYIEMEVNSGDCTEDDAYGMILRASQHGQPTQGYLVAFTCDGRVYAKRLVSVTPYNAVSILNPTETDLIYEGKNQTNIMGVLIQGNTITIYPNRIYFTTITDDTFDYGRYGIFVQAGEGGDYTFTVEEIRTWGAE